MSYRPIFNNNCFSANSALFIPAFKGLQKSISSVNEATSHRLRSKGPGELEAHEKLRARKDKQKKLVDDNDVIKHDKHHAANLLSRPNPATFADRDHDVVVTAIANTQPPPSLSINPHPIPPFKLAQHEHVTSHMPMSTPSELNQNRGDNQGNGLEQRGGPTQAGVGISEMGKHGQVTREVEITVGECTPPTGTSIVPYDEHNQPTSSCARLTSPSETRSCTYALEFTAPPYSLTSNQTLAPPAEYPPTPKSGSKRQATTAFSPTSVSFADNRPSKHPSLMTLEIPEFAPSRNSNSVSPLELLQSFSRMSLGSLSLGSSPHVPFTLQSCNMSPAWISYRSTANFGHGVLDPSSHGSHSPAQPPPSSYRTTQYRVSATHHHHLLIPHPEPMSNKW